MARNPLQLSQQQVDVLTWIKGGSPDGIYDSGYQHRIVARALESRGLVSISGRGPTWSATITEAGIVWLDTPPVSPPVELSEAESLLREVIDAEGSLDVESPYGNDHYRKLVEQSLKSEHRPFGKKLTLINIGSFHTPEARVVLVDHLDDQVEPSPVPVPTRVQTYHPAVKAFLKDREWSFVSPDFMTRAGHILQVIVGEAERRDFAVLEPSALKTNEREHGRGHAHLALRDEDAIYWVRIMEVPAAGGAKLSQRPWNQPKRLPEWRDRRNFEFISSGKLELRVFGPIAPYDGNRYRDAKRVTLEERLPEMFRALEIYRLKRAALVVQREQENDLQQRHWELAMERAKLEFAREFQWADFTRRAAAWHQAAEHRAYLAALRARLAEAGSEGDRQEIERWVTWAEGEVEDRDPLNDPSRIVPAVPVPKPDQLVPFLGGRSPYAAPRR